MRKKEGKLDDLSYRVGSLHAQFITHLRETLGGIWMGIVSKPEILGGKPVVEGTRIPVELLLGLVGAGLAIDDILLEFPGLHREAVLMVLRLGKKAHWKG